MPSRSRAPRDAYASASDIIHKYVEGMRIPLDTVRLVNEKMRLPEEGQLSAFARPRRLEAVHEAIGWQKGPDQSNRKITELYSIMDYTVAVGKPGKEAAPDYKLRNYVTHQETNNPNDMNPQIIKAGRRVEGNFTFEDMFAMVEKLMRSDLFGLELLGMILFRAAFMLDHKKNIGGNWRYNPPKEIMTMIEKRIPSVSEIPIEVFVHFLEVIALNEDVKVYTLGYDELKHGYGRINTLLTFVHLIAVLLNRTSLAKFAGTFARPPAGMAPLSKTKALECFPLLSPARF